MGQLQYANKRFLDFLGMTTDELAASFVEPIHPDERETMQNEWLRSSAVGQAVEVVQRLSASMASIAGFPRSRGSPSGRKAAECPMVRFCTRTSMISGGRKRGFGRAKESFADS